MESVEQLGTDTLFNKWRGGSAEAGREMAQRFSDWYYAVASSRLGEAGGREPLERACQCFAQGILGLNEAKDLAPWAHELLLGEINAHGGRNPGDDQPGRATGQRSPTSLLRSAAGGMSREPIRILALAYDASFPIEGVMEACKELGGYPYAVLHARYQVKNWLADNEGVEFEELPAAPSLDRAPLPLYEAGRMQSSQEDGAFERWMLSDLALCRDVAEFSPFALALRGGALAPNAGTPITPRSERIDSSRFQLPKAGGEHRMLWWGLGLGFVLVLLASWASH